MQILISILAFIAAIGVLVTVHEFGHFIVARSLGIKVLRFSIGFGKPLLTWRRKGDDTEYVIAALPLGGYVKMVDEREGAVAAADLPRAFNRQPLKKRLAVVLAGPVFNLVFAVLAYWVIFMAGVPDLRAAVGYVTPGSPAAAAGLRSGDEILAVAGHTATTWGDVQLSLFREVLRATQVEIRVRNGGQERELQLPVSNPRLLTEPNQMLPELGLSIAPAQSPVIGQIQATGTAAASGLKVGDRVLMVRGKPVATWQDLVHTIRASAGMTLPIVIERGGHEQPLDLKVENATLAGTAIGRVGAGGPAVSANFYDGLQVEQRYNPAAALWQGLVRTVDMSGLTLVAAWNMLLGNVSLHNISGPIDIAQVAGVAAQDGLTAFLEFLAFVSISLGVMNLLPIPVLDGGHVLYFAAEFVKGSPLTERVEIMGQRVGIALLMVLMVFAVYNDLVRVFS